MGLGAWWLNLDDTGSASGSASITEQGDGVAASGNIVITGNANLLEVGDSLAGFGSVDGTASGVANITESGDALSGEGGIVSVGAGDIAETGDVAEGAGSAGAAEGSANIVEGGDSCRAVGVGSDDGRIGAAGRGGWERWAKRQRALEDEIRKASDADIVELVESLEAEPIKLPGAVKRKDGSVNVRAVKRDYAQEVAAAVEKVAEIQQREEEDMLLTLMLAA